MRQEEEKQVNCAAAHPALQPLPLPEGERVGLGDDRNHIDLVVDGLHELDVQRFQAGWDKTRKQRSKEKCGRFKSEDLSALKR